MKQFLAQEGDLGLEAAWLFELMPRTYYEHTDSRAYLDHPQCQPDDPEPI